MQRHRTDILAMLFGLMLCAIGGAFLVHETTGRDVDPAWVAAVAFVALGLIALAVTLTRPAHESGAAAPVEPIEPAEPVGPPESPEEHSP